MRLVQLSVCKPQRLLINISKAADTGITVPSSHIYMQYCFWKGVHKFLFSNIVTDQNCVFPKNLPQSTSVELKKNNLTFSSKNSLTLIGRYWLENTIPSAMTMLNRSRVPHVVIHLSQIWQSNFFLFLWKTILFSYPTLLPAHYLQWLNHRIY